MTNWDHGNSLLSLVLSVVSACDGVFMSRTAVPHIVAHGLVVLVLRPDRMVRWIDHLGFLAIVLKTVFDPLLAHVTYLRGQKVDSSSSTSNIRYFSFDVARQR